MASRFRPTATIPRESASGHSLLPATGALAAGLAEVWLSQGHYGGAASFIRRTSDRERLLASERESRGCALMTMYKSTGKEFDGVVLIEGKYRSSSASVTGARFRGIRSARRGNGKEV